LDYKKNIRQYPEYEFFTKGLMVRIFGAMALGLVYFFTMEVATQQIIIKVHQPMVTCFLKIKKLFGRHG